MNVLADTNILVRGIHRNDPQHKEALRAIRALRNAGDTVCIVPQNLYELWAVATRPAESNGLALTPQQADRVLTRLEQLLVLMRDTPAVYDETMNGAALLPSTQLPLCQHSQELRMP